MSASVSVCLSSPLLFHTQTLTLLLLLLLSLSLSLSLSLCLSLSHSFSLSLSLSPHTHTSIGTCADRTEDHTIDACDEGRWTGLSLVKACSTGYFFYFAFQDWVDRRHYYRDMSSGSSQSMNGQEGAGGEGEKTAFAFNHRSSDAREYGTTDTDKKKTVLVV